MSEKSYWPKWKKSQKILDNITGSLLVIDIICKKILVYWYPWENLKNWKTLDLRSIEKMFFFFLMCTFRGLLVLFCPWNIILSKKSTYQGWLVHEKNCSKIQASSSKNFLLEILVWSHVGHWYNPCLLVCGSLRKFYLKNP